MSAVVAALTNAARRQLRYKQADLNAALIADDEVIQRRAAKSVATYTAKVLCPHTFITHRRLRVHGYDKHAYTCNECKTHILERLEL